MPKHILVLGDPIEDIYLPLEPNGVAQEAPVVRFRQVGPAVHRDGGASNVAAQIRELTKFTDWTVREYPGADMFRMKCPQKIRGMVGTTEVFRYDKEHTVEPISPEAFHDLTSKADAVVISDYEKGALDKTGWFHFSSYLKTEFFIDCKDPSKYPNTPNSIFFPNVKEHNDSIFNYDSRWCLITSGKEGARFTGPADKYSQLIPSPLPNNSPKSVVGAGDIVVAAFTVARMLNLSLIECAKIATAAASLAISKPNTPNVTLEELQDAYSALPEWNVIKFCKELMGNGETDIGIQSTKPK